MNWAESVLDILNQPYKPPEETVLIGQPVIREQIAPYLYRYQRFPHSLIMGPAGIGKTHLARWIASQVSQPFEEFLAPIRAEQLLDSGLVLIDEAHRQTRPEQLFPLMEKGRVTVMAATTRPEQLDSAFASRFVLRLQLEPLSQADSEALIAHLLDTDADVSVLAAASAGNPRQAQRIVEAANAIDSLDPAEILGYVRINADGLDDLHLKILKTLRRTARPMGVNLVATLLYTSEQEIKEHERLLLDYGLLDLTTGGRQLTKKGGLYIAQTEGSE